MSLKNAFNAFLGKKQETEQDRKNEAVQAIIRNDNFLIVQPSKVDMTRYTKIPLMGIAAIGASFAQLPINARSIVQTVTSTMADGQKTFVEVNPKGIQGFMQVNKFGTNGNIMQVNKQGKKVIAGRMRYQELSNGVPVTNKTVTAMPFDPTTLIIAAALMNIEKKLGNIQVTVDEILKFLKLKEQTKQRGNLNMLEEILDEYKQNSENEKRSSLRNIEVQTIKREAHQSILFHQEQIAQKLQNQKIIHGSQQAQGMLSSVMSEFYEYQLACYLYSFTSFLDVMLQKNFDKESLAATVMKIEEHANCYTELYNACHSQITNYQKTSIETQILGGIGGIATFLGKAIGSVPILRDGPVDEALISAGESLDKQNNDYVRKTLERFELIEDSHMRPFLESIHTVNLLYNTPKGLLMDGENLYVLQEAQ